MWMNFISICLVNRKAIYLNFGYQIKFLDVSVLDNISDELINRHENN
jgi:hypothetical protein